MIGSTINALLNPIQISRVVSNLDNIPANSKLIGTHDGSFHCDEALAISMLKLLPEYKTENTIIVRTRKPDVLAQCHIVVDVGAVYDPTTHRYDHHQREFTGVLEGYNTKLSSAGLVYKHFGRAILTEALRDDAGVAPTEDFLDVCYSKLYKNFMEHVDAIDNGVSVAEGEIKYHVSTTMSARVGMLNPAWNEEQTNEIQNDRFRDAMLLTGSEFLAHAQGLSRNWWPARFIVKAALDERLSVHSSGSVIILPQACPWKDHLFELETVMNASPIIYAVYQDMGGSWRIQAVPVTPNSFDSRKKLPAEWQGLRDEVLSEKSGIPGGIFIHASGFIGGHATKEGAVQMAIKALTL